MTSELVVDIDSLADVDCEAVNMGVVAVVVVVDLLVLASEVVTNT